MAPAETGTTRRLTAKGAATRRRIVEAAAELMFERGVAGTSLDDVKAAAGVSGSQMYHYFGEKSQLVAAVVDHQADAVVDAQQPLISQLDGFEKLRAWIDLMIEVQSRFGCEGGCPIGSIAGEVGGRDADVRDAMVRGFAKWQELIRQGLQAMRDRGELSQDADPDQLALMLLAAIQGGLLLTQTRRDPQPLRTALDGVLAYIETFAPERPR